MARSFPIGDLRTLAARALQVGDYTPAASARVRAVPDTRTIRYYTTLGLIDRPAEMRGRTAFYTDRHVLQLVAIKRLQGQNMTLSDIQSDLIGVGAGKLGRIASLPDGFWKDADRYLSRPPEQPQRSEQRQGPGNQTDEIAAGPKRSPSSSNERQADFWAQPAETPIENDNGTPSLTRCLRVTLQPGVNLSIDLSPDITNKNVNLDKLETASAALIVELIRQGLLPDPTSHSSLENSQ